MLYGEQEDVTLLRERLKGQEIVRIYNIDNLHSFQGARSLNTMIQDEDCGGPIFLDTF
jgi:hypothetical protein